MEGTKNGIVEGTNLTHTTCNEQGHAARKTTVDTTNQQQMVNNVYESPRTKQLIQYYHATTGFLTKATWLKSIKGRFYATWSMLTATAVINYFPESDKTEKGHMQQN